MHNTQCVIDFGQSHWQEKNGCSAQSARNGFMKNVVRLSLQLLQPVTFVYNKNFKHFKIIKYFMLNFNYFYCQSKYIIHIL